MIIILTAQELHDIIREKFGLKQDLFFTLQVDPAGKAPQTLTDTGFYNVAPIQELIQAARENQKLQAIKIVRELTGESLLGSKTLVDKVWEP